MRYKKKDYKILQNKKKINKYKGKTIKGYNKEDIIKKEDNKRYYIKGIIEKV